MADLPVLICQMSAGAVLLGVCAWYGPLAGVRHELHRRLASAGVFGADQGRMMSRLEQVVLWGRPDPDRPPVP